MSGRIKHLPHCPVCSRALTDADVRCGLCQSELIEEADFVDVADRSRYRNALASARAAWVDFDGALRAQLEGFGSDWRKISNWKKIWEQVRERAARANFDELAAQGRAGEVWLEIEHSTSSPETDESKQGDGDESREETRPLAANLERVRLWVAELADGEIDVMAWALLVKTLDKPFDISVLEAFRDQEIDRQFSTFETVRVNASGHLVDRRQKRVKQFVEKLDDGVGLVMLKIPGGEFRMGAKNYAAERPVHTVRVSEFYLGRYAVTQAQWRVVARLPKVGLELGEADSSFKGDDLPVECVSWPEAVEFCARLSSETGRPYRLPSEAEWEYACRAGSDAPFSYGETITPVIVNYDGAQPYGGAAAGISRRRTVAAGFLGAANDFGLFDMHGNVWEWCADEWHNDYGGAPSDGLAWIVNAAPDYRVIRGGSWAGSAEVCRSSDRHRERTTAEVKLHYLGFRVAVNL